MANLRVDPTTLWTGTEAKIRDKEMLSFCPSVLHQRSSSGTDSTAICSELSSCHVIIIWSPKLLSPPGKIWAWENPQLIAVHESLSHLNKVLLLCQWLVAAQPMRTYSGPLVSFGPHSAPCYEPGVAGWHTFTQNTVAPAKISPLPLPILLHSFVPQRVTNGEDRLRQLL